MVVVRGGEGVEPAPSPESSIGVAPHREATALTYVIGAFKPLFRESSQEKGGRSRPEVVHGA